MYSIEIQGDFSTMASFKSYFQWILNSVWSLLAALLLAQITSLYIRTCALVKKVTTGVDAIALVRKS